LDYNDLVSRRYRGTAGEEYYRLRQRDTVEQGYALNLEYFEPYLHGAEWVLDFGCGNGGMLALIAARVPHPVGLEVNPVAAAAARERGCEVYATLPDMPPHYCFDLVVSNHVLEHVRHPTRALEQVRERLRPGGLFVTKLPMEEARYRRSRRWEKDDIDHHLHTWTPRLFANTLSEAGYEVVDCRVVNSAWHPKLFGLSRLGLDRAAFWALAVLGGRRQLLGIGRRPG
jgi:SAM-dependent methyltransferase